MCQSRGGRPQLCFPNSPYGLRERRATLIEQVSNANCHGLCAFCPCDCPVLTGPGVLSLLACDCPVLTGPGVLSLLASVLVVPSTYRRFNLRGSDESVWWWQRSVRFKILSHPPPRPWGLGRFPPAQLWRKHDGNHFYRLSALRHPCLRKLRAPLSSVSWLGS